MPEPVAGSSIDPASIIEKEIKSFVRFSPLNRMPALDNEVIFDEPLVQFADGDDPIFSEYKSIIVPGHLTPREAIAKSFNKNPEEMPARLSVISWILPITGKTRASNRQHKRTPSRLWACTRWHGENFNEALRKHVVSRLVEMDCLATAPMLEPYFEVKLGKTGHYSNWSERHVAYAAGLGTFSLSDGFITERGIAHRCGSVVTSLELPASPKTAAGPYANCLFHARVKCRSCITRCPAGAITEAGHDKIKCNQYCDRLNYLKEKYDVKVAGCGLCQTKVPCESSNPVRKLKK